MNHVVLITSFISEKETKWKLAFAPSLATMSNAIWAFLHCSRFLIYINDVLHDMLGQFVIDNILKYFPSTQSHVSHVKQVLDCTLPNHFYLKREKCKLYMFTVLIPCDFLTHQGNSVVCEWPRTLHSQATPEGSGLAYYKPWILLHRSLTEKKCPKNASETHRERLCPTHHGGQRILDRGQSCLSAITLNSILWHSFQRNWKSILLNVTMTSATESPMLPCYKIGIRSMGGFVLGGGGGLFDRQKSEFPSSIARTSSPDSISFCLSTLV